MIRLVQTISLTGLFVLPPAGAYSRIGWKIIAEIEIGVAMATKINVHIVLISACATSLTAGFALGFWVRALLQRRILRRICDFDNVYAFHGKDVPTVNLQPARWKQSGTTQTSVP